jgi:hypothetical protein
MHTFRHISRKCALEPLEERRLLTTFYWDPHPNDPPYWHIPANWREDGGTVERTERVKLPSLSDHAVIYNHEDAQQYVFLDSDVSVESVSVTGTNFIGGGDNRHTFYATHVTLNESFVQRITFGATTLHATHAIFADVLVGVVELNAGHLTLAASTAIAQQVVLAGPALFANNSQLIVPFTLTAHDSVTVRDGGFIVVGSVESAEDSIVVGPGGVMSLQGPTVDAALIQTKGGVSGGRINVSSDVRTITGALVNGGVMHLSHSDSPWAASLSMGSFVNTEEGILELSGFRAAFQNPLESITVRHTAEIKGGVLRLSHAWAPAPGMWANVFRPDSESGMISGRFSSIDQTPMHSINDSTTSFEKPIRVYVQHFEEGYFRLLVLEPPRKWPFSSWWDNPTSTSSRLTPEDGARNLVLIVHGSAADARITPGVPDPWPVVLGSAIQEQLRTRGREDEWDIAVLNWSHFATGHVDDFMHGPEQWWPWTASSRGISIGDALARWMLENELTQYMHVHLFGHSAGSWLVDSFADTLKSTMATSPFIHLTLFDAFFPEPPWEWRGQVRLGDPDTIRDWRGERPVLGDSADYAEHYLDSRQGTTTPFVRFPLVPSTDARLMECVNIDVTDLDPNYITQPEPYLSWLEVLSFDSEHSRRSHRWPIEFYLDTVASPNLFSIFGYGNSRAHQNNNLLLSHGRIQQRRGILWELNLSGHFVDRTRESRQISVTPHTVSATPASSVTIAPESLEIVQQGPGKAVAAIELPRLPFNVVSFVIEVLGHGDGNLRVFLGDELILEQSHTDSFHLPAIPHRIQVGDHPAGLHYLRFELTSTGVSTVRLASPVAHVTEQLTHLADWQNPVLVYDVNQDRRVSASDALAIINHLLLHGSHVLPPSEFPQFFIDVTGDDRVTPSDALMVINYLLLDTQRLEPARDEPPDQSGAVAPVNYNRHGAYQQVTPPPVVEKPLYSIPLAISAIESPLPTSAAIVALGAGCDAKRTLRFSLSTSSADQLWAEEAQVSALLDDIDEDLTDLDFLYQGL